MYQHSTDPEWYVKLGSPTKGIAPMVDGSELPYRLLTRRYGVELAWTPMHSTNTLVTSSKAMTQLVDELKHGESIDRPLVLQLSGNNPSNFELAYNTLVQMGAGCCFDVVELNMGCPQAVALRGKYGAYLMGHLDLAEEILRTLVAVTARSGLGHKVAVKTRLDISDKDTVKMCLRLCSTGIAMFTLHGRTRLQRTGSAVGLPDWQALASILNNLRASYPHLIFFANGGVWNLETHEHLRSLTGCHGTMSASMLTENAGVYNCRDGLNKESPTITNLTCAIGEHWTDQQKVQKRLAMDQSLRKCVYVASKAVQEYPLDAPMYADLIKTWIVSPEETEESVIRIQLAERSLEQRRNRIMLALEYLLIARDMPAFVTVSQLTSHVMRLIGRDLAAANVDLRQKITIESREKIWDASASGQEGREEAHPITKMCNTLLEAVCELYYRMDNNVCCISSIDSFRTTGA
ncbi:putative tRNA dihydrouridine synthase [Giardia duodenalis]|uniref:tRNA dihydrouridine synthase n=1 Tax=Giardia intestinalis (strain ATCC 50803 / WB clone C6) TaxID=184922 RepID=A8BQT4_GIAIC|nr:putative tRNA dihydrouridine synthase [Giardia intestinalis]KAE8304949.1 putative tRNA dihydrouridine synthase [Giardia intestinalis]|eukprot:XP_001705482.1 tRNA dihydrouridine synthase, putative [Giardia lamblia ATCC 50803]